MECDVQFHVNSLVGVGPKPDEYDVNLLVTGAALGFQPASTTFVTNSAGIQFAILFPTLFFDDPLLPGMVYQKKEGGQFEFSHSLPDVMLGSARDSVVLESHASGRSAVVVVDHGLEYRDSYDRWPFGDIWLGLEDGTLIDFEQITSSNAFYHSVDSFDANGDGLSDIIASHMGVKEGGINYNLHLFIQNLDGTFRPDRALADAFSNIWGAGAVAAVRIGEDESEHILKAAYLNGSSDWALIQIGLSADLEPSIISEAKREGLFDLMGVTRIRAIDVDGDGNNEIALSFEGTYPGTQGRYTGNGIEIYRKDSSGHFNRMTESLFEEYVWLFNEFQFREFEVLDFDFDGRDDIVLNGWSGADIQSANGRDFGPMLLRNVDGSRFESFSEVTAFGQDGQMIQTMFTRAVKAEGGVLELFGVESDGTPITVQLAPRYRDIGELVHLRQDGDSLFGYGGNDLISVSATSGLIDGGPGQDTVKFDITRQEAVIVLSETDSINVTLDQAQDSSQVIEVRSVERFEFTDGTLLFDLTGSHDAEIYKLYGAAFARRPDEVGLRFWSDAARSGLDITITAEAFLSSEEFEGMYGPNMKNEEFISLLYRNILGRDGDIDGIAFWSKAMHDGLEKAEVLVEFATSKEYHLIVAPDLLYGYWVT